jgi:hypothetical protein
MVSEGSTEIAATEKIRSAYVNVLNFIGVKSPLSDSSALCRRRI